MKRYRLYAQLPSGARFHQWTTKANWIAQERAAGFIGGGEDSPATGGWSKTVGGFTVGGSIEYVETEEEDVTGGQVSGTASSAPEPVA